VSVRAYLGLGANLGDREANLKEAIRRIEGLGTVAATAPVVETEPWGVTDQPRFLNTVVALDTDMGAEKLHHALRRIEVEMGRTPGIRYGPRLIDIDLLLFGDETIDTPELTVPHPRMKERAFVMEPLAEIAPDLARRVAAGEKD
jgi:2-amino-4-hydroxy-6-hydroxymethyldihydropteridine diphosphokinase